MNVNKEKAKQILQQLTPKELELYKKINRELSGVNEANIQSLVKGIASNWKNLSGAMLMALMMNSNVANAINKYSPETYKDIRTELSKDTARATSGRRVVSSTNIEQTFESGKANINDKTVQLSIDNVKKWVAKNNGKNYKIVVVAGESQVPNQSGFEKKGSLAQHRADEVKRRLQRELNTPIETQIIIGNTPYDRSNDNPKDTKYQREQFIKVNIEVDAESVCNFSNGKPGTQGTAENGYVTFDDYVTGDGSFTISPGQIPDRLIITDVNGNVKADTGYITTEQSKYASSWKYVPAYVLELTKVRMTKVEALQGNSIKTIHVKDFQDLVSQLSNSSNPQMKGNEIAPALAELEAMVNKGVKEFVIYDNMGNGTVKFNEQSGDLKATVYSPVGKTGYTLQGNCN
jgi:hypothetical protein